MFCIACFAFCIPVFTFLPHVRRGKVSGKAAHDRRHLARDGQVIQLLPTLTRLGDAGGFWRLVAWSSLDDTETVYARPLIVAPSAGLGQNRVGATLSDE